MWERRGKWVENFSHLSFTGSVLSGLSKKEVTFQSERGIPHLLCLLCQMERIMSRLSLVRTNL